MSSQSDFSCLHLWLNTLSQPISVGRPQHTAQLHSCFPCQGPLEGNSWKVPWWPEQTERDGWSVLQYICCNEGGFPVRNIFQPTWRKQKTKVHLEIPHVTMSQEEKLHEWRNQFRVTAELDCKLYWSHRGGSTVWSATTQRLSTLWKSAKVKHTQTNYYQTCELANMDNDQSSTEAYYFQEIATATVSRDQWYFV